MSKKEQLDSLRHEIASHLCKIERICHEYNLTAISRFTVVARDPANDEMIICITNEPDAELQAAFDGAIKAQGRF
ncbi:MAG TPA: hypothetical protein VF762_14310 [Blastocatellia bacterium]|jgi:hypothetical protein